MNTVVLREKALGYLGHEVIAFDDTRFMIPGRIRARLFYLHQWDLNRLNHKLVKLAKEQKPDCCMIVGGHNVLPQTVAKIKEMGIPIALWTSDVPVNFKNILETAPFYDHLFCAGSEAMDIFHSRGFKNVSWIPFACDPYFHKSIVLSPQEQELYAKDIVFVGSYYPNRARLLEGIADFNLGVWGPYWQKLAPESPLKQKAVDSKINYNQWVKIFNGSKINVVVHYQDGKVACHQASPKLYEAMACGCFVLCDRQKDALSLFKDKHHLVFFENEVDLREKINYYLIHDKERKDIALAGQQEVLSRHTYQDRLKLMIEILFKG